MSRRPRSTHAGDHVSPFDEPGYETRFDTHVVVGHSTVENWDVEETGMHRGLDRSFSLCKESQQPVVRSSGHFEGIKATTHIEVSYDQRYLDDTS